MRDLKRFDFGAAPDTDVKVQAIRVVDLLLLGPVMIWAAYRAPIPKAARVFLGVSGAATMLFNGVNLARAADMRAQRKVR